ncbi:ribose-5-phosphate isomerase RpiA [Candidatus Bathyarchaeota archaeon]|nr:ribose-5-phosphate isomerase RpiA [Candidatus Bathyarchaeota archaeon]
MVWRESAKERAAVEAVKLVKDGFVLGIGAGSTVAYALREIARRIREEHINVLVISASSQTSQLARQYGIPLTSLEEHLHLDLDIDGADQIDKELNLIKGMGGALTREKIVASVSKTFVVVGDESKLTNTLGKNQPLPIEVLPFSLPFVMSEIKKIGGQPVLKKSSSGDSPFITDNGNYVLNADFGVIKNPWQLNRKLKSLPGVVETGLFLGMADMAIVGTERGIKILRKNQ